MRACAPLGRLRRPRAACREDWYRFQALSDLQIAPDGAAVAYLVTTYDKEADESRSALWMRGLGARRERAAHARGERHGSALQSRRALPELSGGAARPRAATQLWLLDRRGGEARAVSHVSGEITGYEWSPDGAHVVLVMQRAMADGERRARRAASRPSRS